MIGSGATPISLVIRHASELGAVGSGRCAVSQVAMNHSSPIVCSIRMQRDGAQCAQERGRRAVLVLRQIVRLVCDDQIPITIRKDAIRTESRIGSDHDAVAGVVGSIQARDVQAERLPGIDPVLNDLVGRGDDDRVRLSLTRKALDDAEAGERLSGAGAIREQHAVAVRLGKPLFGLVNVLLLARKQVRQRLANVRQVAYLDCYTVCSALFGPLAELWCALVSRSRSFTCCGRLNRNSCVAKSTASRIVVSSGRDERRLIDPLASK